MKRLFRDVAGPCLAPRGSVVCIGAFDGVHRGHRAVIDHVLARATASSLSSIVVSFAPIPRVYFSRGAAVSELTSATEKARLVLDTGVDAMVLLRFDARLASMDAERFIERVIVERLGAREVWVGEDFRFGHARGGDLALLQRTGKRLGFHAGSIDPVAVDGDRVSSSRIRALLSAGKFEAASHALGRRFAIGGHVVRGQQLGRKLGYPTANLRLGRRVSPVMGVFAVRVHGVRQRAMPAVASLGVRPTVNGTEPLLEAHLFDFDGDLYGKKLHVEFCKKLRDEEKFDSLDAMVQQIHRDAAQAREILGCVEPSAVNA